MSLKHSLLSLLSRKPKTGYELSKAIEGSTGFFWTATHQQIYRDLAGLERSRWVRYKKVAQSEKPDKKIYTLTQAGLKELKRWLKEPAEPAPSKDALLVKLFVGHLIKPAVLLKDILRHKKIHQSRLNRYAEIKKDHFQNVAAMSLPEQFQYLTLQRGVTFERGWLAWCEETEVFLKDLGSKSGRTKKSQKYAYD